jgi:methyltransferase (TIGR00027 family)
MEGHRVAFDDAGGPICLDPVEESALLQAWWRSNEAERTSPIVFDPVASLVVAKLLSPDVKARFQSSALDEIASQIHLESAAAVDNALRAWFKSKSGSQVLNLGAGFDARPFRDWPDTQATFFHVDTPSVVHIASSILPPLGRLKFVAGNVQRIEYLFAELKKAGFKPNVPTAVLIEGVAEFLGERRSQELLRAVRMHAPPNSVIFVQLLDPEFINIARRIGGASWRKLPDPVSIASALSPWMTEDLNTSFSQRACATSKLVHVYRAEEARN